MKEKLKKRLKKIMRKHIGKSNAIESEDLFSLVFELSPYQMNVFEVTYLWNIVKTLIRELRRDNELFIINSVRYLYVLETQEECKHFENRIDATIKALEKTKQNARDWVNGKKYRYI